MQAHFYGLNLSRAWMIEGIISGLPTNDKRINALQKNANIHRQIGLENAICDHYSGSHWLGTFAVYLTTSRGLNN